MLRSSAGVPRIVHLDALGQEALATALAATGERGTAAFGLHARTETVLAFARALGRLVSSFHGQKIPAGGATDRAAWRDAGMMSNKPIP